MKGLLVSILEDKRIGNCSNNGISSRCSQVVLVGEGIPEIFEPSEDAPAVKLVKRILFCTKEYIHCEPVESTRRGNVGYMAGGTFVYSSDSRFPSDYPIPLHDRQETQEQYDMLSR